ncbi:UNVERIFIED_CONTAM: hypothetical protein FKN15_070942 [Acipenser sinensis]
MAALANGWGPMEKAGQLAAALEGEARQILLDLSGEELASYEELATALKCHFGTVEPVVGLRQCLVTCFRRPDTWHRGDTPIFYQRPKRTWPPRSLSVA